MRHFLPAILALSLCGCESEGIPEENPLPPTPAEQLASLGKLAAEKNPQIKITGKLGAEIAFVADYAPQEGTLTYELKTGGRTERITVSPERAIYSSDGQQDRQIERSSAMPNGKDWPYACRMAAPFLDAIDGYSATRHSFEVAIADPPAAAGGGERLRWFSLQPNKDTIHDLMLMEFSKISALMIGIDPDTGLLKSLYSIPNTPEHPPTEIRATP